jgi:RecA-family ATPase
VKKQADVRPLFPQLEQPEQTFADEHGLRMPMDWGSLDGQEPPQRTWRIDHWLTTGPTLMAGAGGVGKSLLAQMIGTALALGRPYIAGITEPTVVLMWACEDDHDELWRRQVAICKYFGVSLADLQGKFILEPRLGRDNALYVQSYGVGGWTPLRRELKEQLNDYGARALFLDNIAQVYGGNEIDRHQVTAFCNGIAGLRADLWSPVIMGHPGRAQGSEFSGSGAWENAVRMRWFLGTQLPDKKPDDEEEQNLDVRYLAKRKTNYTAKDYVRLTYRDGAFVPDAVDDSLSGGVSRQMRSDGAERAVIGALRRFGELGIVVVRGHTSPDYLPKQMQSLQLASDYTRRELDTAMNRLMLAGTVVEAVVGEYSNRNPRRGLRLA